MNISPFSIYERLLRFGEDWSDLGVELDELNGNLHITIRYKHSFWTDKETGEVFPIFDFRTERVWWHLDRTPVRYGFDKQRNGYRFRYRKRPNAGISRAIVETNTENRHIRLYFNNLL
jgi:hypothetical protein